VQASDGKDVTGGSVSIGMSGGTVGQFKYGSLSSPVTLVAGATYYVVSQEAAGGDTWYNYDSRVTTAAVAAEGAALWGYGEGQWYPAGAAGQVFVPVDFKYESVPSSATAYVTGVELGKLRNDYSGWVGMEVVVGASPVTVTQLGRMMASGNSGTHTV